MTDDNFDASEYDPREYWSSRARTGGHESLGTVCVARATEVENRCADRLQRRALAYALRSQSLAGASVLEYGCGNGRWADFFIRRGATWSGVDISPDMLDLARDRVADAELGLVTDGRIPHPDSRFDLVYSVTVVHHNPYDDQEKIIGEMCRVLRPGGRLLLLEDLGGQARRIMFPRTLDGWIDMLGRHGMRCIQQQTVRYWILRDLGGAISRFVKRIAGLAQGASAGAQDKPPRMSRWRRLIGPLDLLLDPFLQWLVPASRAAAGTMVFEYENQ